MPVGNLLKDPHHPPLPLNKHSVDKYKELLSSGKFGEELNKAYGL